MTKIEKRKKKSGLREIETFTDHNLLNHRDRFMPGIGQVIIGLHVQACQMQSLFILVRLLSTYM